VVSGSILTLAHHGARAGRPCPCSLPNFPELGIEAVGISHVDLDTIGGILAIMGQKPDRYNWVQNFWACAARVDVEGVHKMTDDWLGDVAPEMVKESLNAWWAFSESQAGRVYPPRDGSAAVVDLSEHFKVLRTLLVPEEIEDEDTGETRISWAAPARQILVEAGRKWAADKEALEKASYVGTAGADVLLRQAEQFVNHLYNHNGRPHKAVVGFNPKVGSITVSVSDPIEGFSCSDFVKSLWGPDAGGHAGIAGSPRGRRMSFEEADAAAVALAVQLRDL